MLRKWLSLWERSFVLCFAAVVFAAAIFAAGAAGCAGDGVGDGPGGGGGDGSGGAGPRIPDDGTRGAPLIALGAKFEQQGMCAAPATGTPPLRRISRIEYNNAVADLFGLTTRPADAFVPEEKAGDFSRFGSNTVTPVSSLATEQFLTAAEAAADHVVAQFASLSGCSGGMGDAACVKTFLGARARRAWRGALPADERDDLFAGYDAAVAALGAGPALKFGVVSVLLSPRFLYLVEMGTGTSGVVPLTPHEVGGRLAAALWRSVPDDALLDAADRNELGTPEQVMAQARRMLEDPRAGAMLGDFARQWLEAEGAPSLAKDNMIWPTFDTALARDLLTESELFFQTAVRENATFPALMTADYTMANARVAALYGVPAPAGSGFAKVSLPPERRGVLTHASVLATHAHFARPSPVLRGKFVRLQLLCDPVPPPPDNVDTTVKPLAANQTERELAAAHASQETCRACHTLMDPIGHAFEQFDAIGKYIGPSAGTGAGEIVKPGLVVTDDVSGTFTGAAGLGAKLGASQHAGQCYLIQSLRYALGREEAAGDACSANQAWKIFSQSGLSLKEAVVAVTATPSFRHRTGVAPGGACQ
jgi:hypothetical protein